MRREYPRSASDAGLRYVSDRAPGIRRVRRGRGFIYVAPSGAKVRDPATLRRIRALVIPPAWNDVWISTRARGHIQAVGRDAKGRKQYRYHARWRQVRDATKYDRLRAFGAALRSIRAAVARDLMRPGLPREKVLATVVRLLETTFIRVGNEEYAKANGSYGLTTLRARHVEIEGATLRFHFRGKAGKVHVVEAHDLRVARVVRQCSELPGHELFEYIDDDGRVRAIDSADVNEYLRAITGDDFTAKDFRTWAGTVLAMRELRAAGACASAADTRRREVAAIRAVAARLGNTPATCKKCYVHPRVLAAFEAGELAREARRSGDETALMALLRRSRIVGRRACG